MQSSLRLARLGGIARVGPLSTMIQTNAATSRTRHSCLSLIRLRSQSFSSEVAASATSTNTNGRFAVVDHAEAYETAMQGRHGQQLALARLEGIGKDDAPFDPFIEEELAEARALAGVEDSGDEDDDDDVEEAEYVDLKEGDQEGLEDDDDDEDDDEEDDDEFYSVYNRDGSVRRKKSVLATLRAGYPAGGVFAIIELAGSQHKITTDDLMVVNRLQPVDTYKIGSVHTITDVLLVGSSHKTLVGMPIVQGAQVDVMVEENTRDAKVIIFKKRRRKHSERKNGFRRDVTMLRVLDIRMPEQYKDHKHVGREIVDELEDRLDLSRKTQEEKI
jgi:large subunit ribosomal protein L21